MFELFGSYIYVALGILTRAIFPWLVLLYKEKSQVKDWNWYFLRSQIIGSVIIFLLLPLLISDLSAVKSMDWQAAWTAGYAVADISRLIEKALTDE